MKIKKPSFSAGRALLSLLGVAALVAAQIFASLAGMLPLPRWALYPLYCLLYTAATVLLVLALARWVLRAPVSVFRLVPVTLRPVWAACAVLLPALVCALFLLLPGRMEFHAVTGEVLAEKLTFAVFYCGISAGVAEEVVFRGLLMGALEQRWGRGVAAVVPSMVFACLHWSSTLNLVSAVLLFVAGTAVGLMFSLITYESGSVWSAALVHAVWNCVIIGGLLSIGAPADGEALLCDTLDTRAVVLTGGEFGIESSLFAVLGYVGVCAFALVRLRRAAPPKAASPQESGSAG